MDIGLCSILQHCCKRMLLMLGNHQQQSCQGNLYCTKWPVTFHISIPNFRIQIRFLLSMEFATPGATYRIPFIILSLQPKWLLCNHSLCQSITIRQNHYTSISDDILTNSIQNAHLKLCGCPSMNACPSLTTTIRVTATASRTNHNAKHCFNSTQGKL